MENIDIEKSISNTGSLCDLFTSLACSENTRYSDHADGSGLKLGIKLCSSHGES